MRRGRRGGCASIVGWRVACAHHGGGCHDGKMANSHAGPSSVGSRKPPTAGENALAAAAHAPANAAASDDTMARSTRGTPVAESRAT